MKIIKRLFIFIFVLLLLLLGAAFAIPYFFKDKIVAVVKEEVNDRINATVDFDDVDISIFRSFPDLSVGLNDFSVVGKDEFEGVNLIAGKSFDLTLDVMSVVNSATQPIEVKKVHLQDPEVNVFVLKNGKANYDIALPDDTAEETSESSGLSVALREYSIENGNLIYDDRTLNMRVEATDMDHSGVGNFALDVFDLETDTEIEGLTVIYDNIGYLVKSNAKLDLTVNANMESMKFTLKENDLTVNDLKLIADGFVEIPNEKDIDMDLKFEAPQNTFKNLLSVIPNAYIADYKDVKANGNFTLNGFLKGTYNDNSLPAFRINTGITNADVKYPDLPVGISGISAKIDVNSPSSNLDRMTIDIPKFNLKIGNNPVAGYFKLKTPLSDPDMDMKMDGVIDLAELNKAFPIEGMEEMTGKITSDVTVKTKMSTIDREDYANVNMSGALQIDDLIYDAADMPAVKIKHAEADFTPQKVIVPSFNVQTGAKSDLKGSASFDNILAYFSPEKTMKGTMNLQSNYFDADEWMVEEESAPVTTTTTVPAEEAELFDRYDFDFDANMRKIKYDVYDLKDLRAKGNFTPNELKIDDFYTKVGDSDISAKGNVTNVMDYLYENETLGGTVNLTSNYFNLNPFMEEDPAAAAAVENKGTNVSQEDLEPFLVPENIEMLVNTNMKKVIYTDMEITNITGGLDIKDKAVNLKDVKGQTLGGGIEMSGGYGTKDPEKPTFDLKYNLQNMDFQRAFNTFNTFEKIAPIGKYIKGNFNTSLAMTGVLGKDMYPDFNTLNIDGFLQTLNAVVAGFEPLNKVGETLNINALKTVKIKNSKNWLEVKNGRFELEEFDHTHEGIDMKIGGSHAITNEDMKYNIFAKIPREKLGKLNDVAGVGLDWLSGQASKLGINVDAGEFVNVALTITGTMLKPKVDVKLLGTDGEGKSIQDAAKDKLKEEAEKQKKILEDKAKAEADKAKQKAQEELDRKKKELEDKAKAKAKEEAEKLRKKAEEEAKKRLEEEAAKKAAEAAKKAEEALGDKAKEELDKLKDKLPWGKKNNGGN